MLVNEQLLAHLYQLQGDARAASSLSRRAGQRRSAIIELFWNEQTQCFHDLDINNKRHTASISLATAYPLFVGAATEQQAGCVADLLEKDFLKPGGLTTTTCESGQQWDAPNGWAPLQWIAVTGLRRYGHHRLADEIRARWVKLNVRLFQRTGKLLEKYNVYEPNTPGGGGEYAVQDGFGWTNGVLKAFLTEKQ
jgi:alpha,alpha-trehalase